MPRPHIRVLLYRAPWRKNELYFRAQQVVDYFHHMGDRVTVVAGPSGWRGVVRLLAWPWHLAYADLIFLYPQPLMPLFALTAKALGRRVVIDHYVSYVRDDEVMPRLGRWLMPLARRAYRLVDVVLAHTESMAEALCTAWDLPAKQVQPLYSVIDTTHFAPLYANEARRLRRQLGIDDRFVVLYHGLWHTWHGLDTLRQAVRQLAHAGEPVALVLIGRAGGGARHEWLLGEVPYSDLPAYIQMGDVWCSGFASLPRGDRTFSSTMIQAMAMARPVITSPSPEKMRWLRDGENIFLVPTDDPNALADCIRYCRAHPDIARWVGTNARRLAETVFDIAEMHTLLENYLDNWFGLSAA